MHVLGSDHAAAAGYGPGRGAGRAHLSAGDAVSGTSIEPRINVAASRLRLRRLIAYDVGCTMCLLWLSVLVRSASILWGVLHQYSARLIVLHTPHALCFS
jgi:hypothetical protein